jgi:hypothetical protein
MLTRYKPRMNHGTVVAYLALFVALGGGAYAATQLPANSVGTAQLKSGAVTPSKLNRTVRSAASSSGDTLPSGRTLRGVIDVKAYIEGNGSYHSASTSISFGEKLSKSPTVHVIAEGGPSTADCPGTVKSPKAAGGRLCIYVGRNYGALIFVTDTRSHAIGASPFGFGLEIQPTATTVGQDTFYGVEATWAVKAK